MDVEGLVKAGLAVVLPILTAVGIGSRRSRLRNEIRENLALVEEVQRHALLNNHTLSSAWLQGRIATDIARLTGQTGGKRKKPVQKSSAVVALVLALAFGYWTWSIDREGFVWYSVFPGTVSALMAISFWGHFVNRDLIDDSDLPTGAHALATDDADEQIANSVILASTGGIDSRFDDGGQIDVVFSFCKLAQSWQYEEAIKLTDANWLECRLKAWLWNNRSVFGDDLLILDSLVVEALRDRSASEVWRDFVETENRSINEAWGQIDFDQMGAGSRRRRVAPDYDVVILAPVGSTGGYYVESAVQLRNALQFLVRRMDDKWLVANHIATAAPVPTWPPTWWAIGDPAIEMLDHD